MNVKLGLGIITLVLFSSCHKSMNQSMTIPEKIAKEEISSHINLDKIVQGCPEFISSRNATNKPLSNDQIICCLIECASNGNEECESHLLEMIKGYPYRYNKGYITCRNPGLRGVKTKLIFEAYLSFVDSHQDKLFQCQLAPGHNYKYCLAQLVVGDLSIGVKDLSKAEIKWLRPEDLDLDFDPYDREDECSCNGYKLDFKMLKKLYESGNLELYDYYYQAVIAEKQNHMK